jgi:hypothetical protein
LATSRSSARVWEYAVGKPKDQIEMSATLSMDLKDQHFDRTLDER